MVGRLNRARPRWWQNKNAQIGIYGIVSLGATLIMAGAGGLLWFLIAVTVFPLIGILTLVPEDKRQFLRYMWMIHSLAWWIGALFYSAFQFNATTYKLEPFPDLLIGEDIPRLIISTLIGLVFGFAFVILPLWVPASFAAVWLLALNKSYGLSYRQAVWMLIAFKIGFGQPVSMIDEGEEKEVKPKGWPSALGGPRLAIVRPYNAVVLEKEGQVTRVEGPGTVKIQPDERIKSAVDLRRQAKPYKVEKVFTRDRVPLKITGGVGYRIQRLEEYIESNPDSKRVPFSAWDKISFLAGGTDSEQGRRDLDKVLYQSVYKAVYVPRTGQSWIAKVPGDVETEMRKAVREYDFGDIYDPEAATKTASVLQQIIQKVTEETRKSAQPYGVQVFGISVGSIEIDQAENLHNAYFAALVAEWSKRTALKEHEVFKDRAQVQIKIAEGTSLILNRLRRTLVDLASSGIPISGGAVEQYLQLSERVLQNIIKDTSTADRYLETMVTLARINPATILAAGMDISQMSDLLATGVTPSSGDGGSGSLAKGNP